MYYYAFTLRKTQYPAFISFYEKQLIRWRKLFPLCRFLYYYEETSGLHVHGMIKSPDKIYIKNCGIHPGKGYNLDFKLCKSVSAWGAYISKDHHKETSLINSEHELEYEHYLYSHLEPGQRSDATNGSERSVETTIEEELYKQSMLMLRLRNIRLI